MAKRRLTDYVGRYRTAIGLTAVCVCVTVALNLALPYLVRRAVDGLADGTMTSGDLAQLLALYLGASAVAAVFSYFMRTIPLRMAHRVEFDIRRDLFAHLTGLDLAFYRANRTGDLMTRMTSDLGMVRDYVGQGTLQGLRSTAVCLLAFGIMFAIDARLSLILLGLFPVVMLTFFVFIRIIRRRHNAVQETFSEMSDYAQETFAGIRTVKGFTLEGGRRGRFEGYNRELVKRNLSLSAVQQPLWPLFAFWFAVGALLLLIVGGREVVQGRLSLGQLVQFQQYLLYMQWPMLAMSWALSLVQRGRASWDRLLEVFDSTPAIADPVAAPGAADAADAEAPWPDGDIEFEGVTLAAGDRPLLDNIHLRIPRGATVGITGPTGSGKTLLVSLLPRLMDPTQGVVRLGGRDLRAGSLRALRARIGMAPQEPVLFSDTLARNLGFGVEDATVEDVLRASDIAHLHEDVESFPAQYETVLGERGVTLSGGQRQRASLGRALARRPAVLILDDVLASVDAQTEAAILKKLQPVLAQGTSLLVSHRASTLRAADTIVVLEQGRLTQQGTHAELLAQPGYYRELVSMQEMEQQLEASS